jgi:hypothetical protein
MVIPPFVRELLWEYDLDDPEIVGRLDRVLVERVMERGGWEAMRWLLESFDRADLRAFLEKRGRRVLPARELRFWAWASGVPEPTTTSWVQSARKREPVWRV